MAKSPPGMDIYFVLPHNYEAIIERSKDTENPYALEDLEQMRAKAQAMNNVAYVMFMDPGYLSGPDGPDPTHHP